MQFDLLRRVVEELNSLLARARVDRIYQGTDGAVYLLCSRERKKHILLLSSDRRLPRMHLVNSKQTSAPSSHPFVLNIRSRLPGARVQSVDLLNEDRIADIRLVKNGGEYHLIAELTGSSANLLLVDRERKIISVYYPVPPSDHSERILLPGASYVLPSKKIFTSTKKAEVNTAVDLSPNQAAEAYFKGIGAGQVLESARTELRSLLRKTKKRIERRIEAVSSDLDSAARADEFKTAGELVLANLRNIRTGMAQAELAAFDGTTVSVPLDPKLSPTRNAEQYFRKYKKAKSGMVVISSRLDDARREFSYLESFLDLVEHAADPEELEKVRQKLRGRGYGGELKTKTKKALSTTPGYRTILFEGWEILVGRSSAGNDNITTKLARPEDLWLHAEGMPGSHVLVRNPDKTEIPEAVLLRAAALAAWHSKGKLSGKVPVAYTTARHVRKPKGAKPGLVTLSERKTVVVRPVGD